MTALALLDQHAAVFENLLGYPMPIHRPLQYYKYLDADDFSHSAPCPLACTDETNIFTPRLVDQHELIHSYLQSPWRPHLFSEGMADALSCRDPLGGTCHSDWRERFDTTDGETYTCGARLIYQLLAQASLAEVVALEADLGSSPDPDGFTAAVERRFGVPLDTLWARAKLDNRNCVPYFTCSGPELTAEDRASDPAGSRLATSGAAIDDSIPGQRFPALGQLVQFRFAEVGRAGAIEVLRCSARLSPDPEDRLVLGESSAPNLWVESPGNDYVIGPISQAVTVAVESGGLPTSCGSRSFALELGRPLVFRARPGPRRLQLTVEVDQPRPVEVRVEGGGAGVPSVHLCEGCSSGQGTGCLPLDFAGDKAISTVTMGNSTLELDVGDSPLTLRLIPKRNP